MITDYIIKILILILLLLNTFVSFAQMPDWTLIIDKEENKYYIDKNGKIWTSGDPEFDYKPVSIDGIEFYINQGIELIKSHNKAAGLLLLKSIMALPSNNDIIYKAQSRASGEISRLIKIEGDRFNRLNEDASILLFRENNSFTLINDNMLYSIKSPCPIKILSKKIRVKPEYRYYGILLGIRFKEQEPPHNDKNGYSGYDVLIAIDSERFPGPIKNAKRIEEHWRNRLGSDTFERSIVINSNNRILKSYRDKYPPYYSGFEGFYSKKNYGYYIKAITSDEIYQKNKPKITEIISNFQIN